MKSKFINKIKDGAIAGYKKYNILPSLTIAQAILETGWGKSSIGNNIFGIKVTKNWKGKRQLVRTHEYINGKKVYENTYFKDYDTIEESLEDRFKLLSSSRYKSVVQAKDYVEGANALYKSGYATDPNYANKLIKIIEQNDLDQFDKNLKEVKNMNLYINNRKINVNISAKNGTSYINFKGVDIPVRDFFESLGFNVEWEGSTRSIKISDSNFNQPSNNNNNNVQARLNKLGLNSVKELQSIFGLVVDGIVGKNTLNLLNRLDKIKHFKLDEFRCNHCNKLKLDINLLESLEKLREQTGPLVINSGYRCPIHNKRVGGVRNSQHLKGTAADVRAINTKPSIVQAIADKVFSNGGLGRYNTFTHVDVRGHRSRWNG